MRELSERYCESTREFVEEALILNKWSPVFYEDWMHLQGMRTGNICLCFMKASRTGSGGSKKLLKLMGFSIDSVEAAIAEFKARVASSQRKEAIDAILVDLAENGYS